MLMYLVVLGDVEAHYSQKLRLAVNVSFAVSEKLLRCQLLWCTRSLFLCSANSFYNTL